MNTKIITLFLCAYISISATTPENSKAKLETYIEKYRNQKEECEKNITNLFDMHIRPLVIKEYFSRMTLKHTSSPEKQAQYQQKVEQSQSRSLEAFESLIMSQAVDYGEYLRTLDALDFIKQCNEHGHDTRTSYETWRDDYAPISDEEIKEMYPKMQEAIQKSTLELEKIVEEIKQLQQ